MYINMNKLQVKNKNITGYHDTPVIPVLLKQAGAGRPKL